MFSAVDDLGGPRVFGLKDFCMTVNWRHPRLWLYLEHWIVLNLAWLNLCWTLHVKARLGFVGPLVNIFLVALRTHREWARVLVQVESRLQCAFTGDGEIFKVRGLPTVFGTTDIGPWPSSGTVFQAHDRPH